MRRAALAIAAAIALTGCARHAGSRAPAVAPAPVRPDTSAVAARTSAAKSSAARASGIADRLQVMPGQESSLMSLRLELGATTEQLSEASAMIPKLESEITGLTISYQNEAAMSKSLYAQFVAQKAKADAEADKAKRAASERDVFVNLFALSLVAAAMMLAGPLIKNVSASFGMYAPAAAIGLWAVFGVAVYFSAYWLIRLLLQFVVS